MNLRPVPARIASRIKTSVIEVLVHPPALLLVRVMNHIYAINPSWLASEPRFLPLTTSLSNAQRAWCLSLFPNVCPIAGRLYSLTAPQSPNLFTTNGFFPHDDQHCYPNRGPPQSRQGSPIPSGRPLQFLYLVLRCPLVSRSGACETYRDTRFVPRASRASHGVSFLTFFRHMFS